MTEYTFGADYHRMSDAEVAELHKSLLEEFDNLITKNPEAFTAGLARLKDIEQLQKTEDGGYLKIKLLSPLSELASDMLRKETYLQRLEAFIKSKQDI